LFEDFFSNLPERRQKYCSISLAKNTCFLTSLPAGRVVCVSRYSGQKILYGLMMHEDFDRMMRQFVPPGIYDSITDKLEGLKRRVSASFSHIW